MFLESDRPVATTKLKHFFDPEFVMSWMFFVHTYALSTIYISIILQNNLGLLNKLSQK